MSQTGQFAETDQQRIAKEGIEWLHLLLSKNADYGSSVWAAPSLAPELSPASAIKVRMTDKIARLQTLARQPAKVTSETFDDTIRDLGAYCLLYLARPK